MAGTTFKSLGTAVHNGGTVTAGNDIIAAAEAQTRGILTVFVCLDTSTTVQLGVNDGTTLELVDLNASTALTAGAGYAFSWPAITGYSYSLVNKTGGTDSAVRHASFMIETPVG